MSIRKLSFNFLKALMRRGSARMSLNKLEEARTDFDDVLFLEPNNKQVIDFYLNCYFFDQQAEAIVNFE